MSTSDAWVKVGVRVTLTLTLTLTQALLIQRVWRRSGVCSFSGDWSSDGSGSPGIGLRVRARARARVRVYAPGARGHVVALAAAAQAHVHGLLLEHGQLTQRGRAVTRLVARLAAPEAHAVVALLYVATGVPRPNSSS